jgi:hypothetical protein
LDAPRPKKGLERGLDSVWAQREKRRGGASDLAGKCVLEGVLFQVPKASARRAIVYTTVITYADQSRRGYRIDHSAAVARALESETKKLSYRGGNLRAASALRAKQERPTGSRRGVLKCLSLEPLFLLASFRGPG